jgi:SAM-dependent methyltransferase
MSRRGLSLLTTVILLLAATGAARSALNARQLEAISIGLLVVGFVMLLLFLRVELIAVEMMSVLLSVAATVGIAGWLGILMTPTDRQLAVLLLAPPTLLSIAVLSRALRRYRAQPTSRAGVMTLIILLVFYALFFWRYPTIQITSLVSSLMATMLALPAVLDWLLPRDADRAAPAIGAFGRNDVRQPVRSLYAYLDIPAEQYVVWKLRLDPIFSRIDAAVPASGDILDAGCGFGVMSHLLGLRSARRTIVGIDLDENKLRIARCAGRTVGNVRFIHGDLLGTEYPGSDCVLLIDVLHYWTAEKQREIISRCAGALRPGGTLVFREGLAADSWSHRLVDLFERWAVLIGHNPRGDGLWFETRDFYVREFAGQRLRLIEEAPDWGRGSNVVLLLRKQAE